MCHIRSYAHMHMVGQFRHGFSANPRSRSQSIQRFRITVGRVGTVTPGGIKWARRRCRPLCGAEKLSLQGIDIGRIDLSRYSDSELSDLAGNGFASPCSLRVLFALFVNLAQLGWQWDSDSS